MDWVEKIIGAIATFVEFPYNLEDHASSTWFAAVSFFPDVQSIMKCIRFRAFHHDGFEMLFSFSAIMQHATVFSARALFQSTVK
ncbi:hypothetical protein VitviT2T_030460 [Vitis vinifera]|uniref:Uncharacterized protein n=1 Tax=Vitis vinifera TaxID=29760 RepID=A0ABY9E020_VITVI|nr:hypothetical protein VitviT2T_030460 [Vitis vinifera]